MIFWYWEEAPPDHNIEADTCRVLLPHSLHGTPFSAWEWQGQSDLLSTILRFFGSTAPPAGVLHFTDFVHIGQDVQTLSEGKTCTCTGVPGVGRTSSENLQASRKSAAMKSHALRFHLILASVLLVTAFAQDTDGEGFDYNPILCGSVSECDCSGSGVPNCSKCPDDGGSANVNNDVCWCSAVPSVDTGNECNPLKTNGPKSATCYAPGQRNQGAVGYPAVNYKPCCDGSSAVEKANDWGKFCPFADDVPYEPILCGAVSECNCTGAGDAQCSKCPDDGGSANVNNDVCWCSGVPSTGTGNECNPLKTNGPGKKNGSCGRRRRRRRRL